MRVFLFFVFFFLTHGLEHTFLVNMFLWKRHLKINFLFSSLLLSNLYGTVHSTARIFKTAVANTKNLKKFTYLLWNKSVQNVCSFLPVSQIYCLGYEKYINMSKIKYYAGLYGRCSNGVPPIHFFKAEHRIQFRSRPMQFLGFSNREKGPPRQEISK
jgi:hypothetical protein